MQNFLTVVNPDGSLRDTFVKMLDRETCTFRGEQDVLRIMCDKLPSYDWTKHTFINGEHNFPLTALVAHVYVHSRDNYRGFERNIQLDHLAQRFKP